MAFCSNCGKNYPRGQSFAQSVERQLQTIIASVESHTMEKYINALIAARSWVHLFPYALHVGMSFVVPVRQMQ